MPGDRFVGHFAYMTMIRRPLFFLLLLATAAILVGCASTPNYLAPDGPRYAGSFSATPDPAAFDGHPRIVTWNIKYGQNIDGAIETFRSSPALQDADIIFLQEMDAEGVEAFARELNLNYVYYPASVHPNTGRDFGEAVLSPWPLSDDAKIFLPHESLRNGQIRIAVQALVHIPDAPIWAYSVHTETALLPPPRREDQIKALLTNAPDDGRPVVIGGDFNTITPIERHVLLNMMQDAGFAWLTAKAGATVSVQEADIGVIMDYIFARGLASHEAGVVQSQASDHLPLWAQTDLEP